MNTERRSLSIQDEGKDWGDFPEKQLETPHPEDLETPQERYRRTQREIVTGTRKAPWRGWITGIWNPDKKRERN